MQLYATKFFLFLFVLFLATMSSAGIAFLVGACLDSFAVADLVSMLIFVIMMVRNMKDFIF